MKERVLAHLEAIHRMYVNPEASWDEIRAAHIWVHDKEEE